MSRWNAEIEDELRRTSYAGQLDLDGGIVQATTVAPCASREPECTRRLIGELAEETGGEQLPLIEG